MNGEKERSMRFIVSIGIVFLMLLTPVWPFSRPGLAGTTEQVKEESKTVVQEIKEGAVQTGKKAVQIGKEVKADSQKTWSQVHEKAVETGGAIKEGVKEVGKEIKKAIQETKQAIQKEVSSDGSTSKSPAEK
jgi:hypothetical protein